MTPRILSRDDAAQYLSVSVTQIDRLIHTGDLPVVRLPAERNRVTSRGQRGVNRRILIDVEDLTRLIVQSKVRSA